MGTPGRLDDLISTNKLDLSKVLMCVSLSGCVLCKKMFYLQQNKRNGKNCCSKQSALINTFLCAMQLSMYDVFYRFDSTFLMKR